MSFYSIQFVSGQEILFSSILRAKILPSKCLKFDTKFKKIIIKVLSAKNARIWKWTWLM